MPDVLLPESALFQAEEAFGQNPGENAGDELLHAFEQAVIREAYDTAVANLRRAEAAGDTERVTAAQHVCATLAMRLATLGG